MDWKGKLTDPTFDEPFHPVTSSVYAQFSFTIRTQVPQGTSRVLINFKSPRYVARGIAVAN